MNVNQILNMVLRMFMRKAVKGGINMAAQRGKTPAEMSQAERQQMRASRQQAKRARQAARLMRRMR